MCGCDRGELWLCDSVAYLILLLVVSLEPAKKRKTSPVWEYFDQISSNKVKCMLCSKELGYNNNTSSMIRHYRALHENKERNGCGPSQATRKQELDEALVTMIVKDTQPFSIVEDVGFRDFVQKLDPSYVLPTRQAVKAMVEAKYAESKEKAKADVKKVTAVSLTSDLWTSINMGAYLAVACHFVDSNTCLNSVLLGVLKFPQAHTAENVAHLKASLMEEWGITNNVTCLVTDGAANMIACGRELRLRHTVCIAHTLNLIVKKALDQTPVLADIRAKARKLVGYFRSSVTAKEKLALLQQQMGRPTLKLLQEVETRWNSTFQMLHRLVELKEPVRAALASLATEIPPLSSDELTSVTACLSLLSGFNDATVELSEEKKVSGSKVLPLLKMLDENLQEEMTNMASPVARQMGEHLKRQLREKLNTLQSMSIMSLATMLDPRFKAMGFFSPTKANEAIKRLTSECAAIVSSAAQPSASHGAELVTPGNKLWRHLDDSVMESRRRHSVTADATVEVQRYLAEPNIGRLEDPLQYWERQKLIYPHLYRLAVKYLCTPASSVPCERVFSKAGEVVSKKRNRLSPKTVEKLMFLNKHV
ncbi:zinc finger BED domain-containing protein 4-like isoform X1 [Sinocyclocheilus anshuiensis]|uniref:zinc finger BED domain-containing protein 4-like isoform X1 n=2 Tax=Sinocyclocheilus anshuiensis TaxID=1608454 RepID=UPI0007B859D7|nr:PREDICTED: zinc finger BED domain-containing protein 4-like isoform X1 [Sinocyclocheilus anshuiensis]